MEMLKENFKCIYLVGDIAQLKLVIISNSHLINSIDVSFKIYQLFTKSDRFVHLINGDYQYNRRTKNSTSWISKMSQAFECYNFLAFDTWQVSKLD